MVFIRSRDKNAGKILTCTRDPNIRDLDRIPDTEAYIFDRKIGQSFFSYRVSQLTIVSKNSDKRHVRLPSTPLQKTASEL